MATKILTVGAALGSFTSLFSKVRAIDAKHGKFELLLCAGDFFGPSGDADDAELDLLLEGKIDVPFSTYVSQGHYPIPPKVLEKTSKNGGEICPNVFLLAKAGIITTSQKLTLASFGGKFDAETFLVDKASENLDLSSSTFNSSNVSSFLASSALPSSSAEPSLAAIKSNTSTSQIDILLTHGWPSSIPRLAKSTPLPPSGDWLYPPLDDVVKASRPRYHFAAGGGDPPVFWEREPFFWPENQAPGAVTRFVSLGNFGGPESASGAKKPRWFYAFSIAPLTSSTAPLPRPTNATPSPFQSNVPRGAKRAQDDDENGGNFIFGDVGVKRPRLADQRGAYAQQNSNKPKEKLPRPPEGYVCRKCQSTEHFIKDCPERHAVGDTGGKKPPKGYVCRACASEGHYIQDCPTTKDRTRAPPKEISPDECWFCLSNPQLVKHLIVSIGTEIYLTLPKGPLLPTGDASASPTSVPGGGHLLIIPISHYPTLSTIPTDLAPPVLSELDTYKSALRTLYAKFGAVPVFFEVSRLTGKGGHAHVQVVPVPEGRQAEVEGAFRAYGGQQIVWEEDPIQALTSAAGGVMNYFRVDLPDGRKMVHILKPGRMFNLQFGREALAHFLDLPDRVDWKTCVQTEDEEKQDARALKEAFLEHDPSLL